MFKNVTTSQPETTVLLEFLPEELILLDEIIKQQWYQIQDHEYDSWDTTPEKYAALANKVSRQRKRLPGESASETNERCSLVMIAR